MRGPLKVSVCIVTYNQERYIAQCLQSIVDQVVGFDFEVLVSDDASSDRTPEIISEFARRYPNLIKPFLNKKNLGAGPNFVFVHDQARGEYIAHIDGDDYCLPGKLQRQADYLDRHAHCNIVWHKMLVELPDGRIVSGKQSSSKDYSKGEYLYDMEFKRADILQYIAVGANSSKMYRRAVREYEVSDFETLDYFANVEQVGDGVGCFACDEPLGVYRAGVGVSSGGSKTRLLLCKTFLFFAKKYPEYKVNINAAALTCLIADFKNRRNTWWDFFKVYIFTFHLCSVVKFFKGIKVIRQLRFVK
ncbi:glycosyl transferase family 2 [Pseudomonas sp. SWI6]|uniref:glycosyltransferase family 2 protein n=1 Tax=Pseudomonas TaxID=286 RepID=UPI000CE5E9E9|nr:MULTISPECIES: glycosyltransferase [Pseudomonas]AVD84314.1 glycosyl transferase family 2 [Pseudomonas sp. SWI6]MDT8922063.1 glycosyltransferase [Pseudomonas taiwanensis]